MFSLMVEWYCFAASWLVVWSPLVLQIWMGNTVYDGKPVAEVLSHFFPILCVAFSLSAISTVSFSQFGPLNRVGTEVIFTCANAVAMAVGMVLGWHLNGIVGVAWGLLASRLVLVCQDLFIARLVRGKGWLSLANWRRILLQVAIALIFLGARRQFYPGPMASAALACLHGGIIGSWLVFPYWKRWRQKRTESLC
jgi:hypothetical protein